MKVAKLSEAKDELSRYVAQVRRGERVRILVRGVPAADLVPVSGLSAADAESSLAELERAGVIRRGRGGLPAELFRPGPRARGKPVSEALLEERRMSR